MRPFSQLLACLALISVPMAAYANDAPAVGDPNWALRGDALVSNDDGRFFHAVGRAPPGASASAQQQVADKAARDALLKSFIAFLTGLQSAGTAEAATVMSAVQALPGPVVQGMRIEDRYNRHDGSLLSLATLDWTAISAVLLQARAAGTVTSDVEPQALLDMFDKIAKRPPEATAVIGAHESRFGDDSPMHDTNNTVIGVTRPLWADSAVSPGNPASLYICGAGKGSRRSSAEGAAYSVLSKFFNERSEATDKDLMAAAKVLGVSGVNWNDEDMRRNALNSVLSLVRIREVWSNPKGSTYALACLERLPAVTVLRKQIAEDNKKVGDALLGITHKMAREPQMNSAAAAMMHRETANQLMRLIRLTGVGLASPLNAADLADAQKPGYVPVIVAVKAQGPYWLGFANALVVGLQRKGVQVGLSAVIAKPDVTLEAVVSLDDDKAIATAAEASSTTTVKDGLNNKTLATLKSSEKASEKNRLDSERTAAKHLGAKAAQDAAAPMGLKP